MSVALRAGADVDLPFEALPADTLWELYVAEKDEKRRGKIRDALIARYVPLVKIAAGRMMMNLPQWVDYDDLVGYGTLGLLDAIGRFQPGRGVKFETFAFMRIKGAMLDGVRSSDWVPRSVRDKARRLEEAFSKVEQQKGRSASDAEVAEALGMSVDELAAAIAEVSRGGILSLDEILDIDDEGGTVTILGLSPDPDSPDPAVRYEREELLNRLADAIDELPERERLVIALYYYEELTVKEIGSILGVSESRVSQIHTRALLRLRSRLAGEAYIGSRTP
ncbi:MAG TPA: FliA/WhiG family RNA polymerase sigma factor [Firmicutes bacterium]|nr:FliA/WhiG family RNA polymerase sigma factor [Bacillota bacterium]